MKKTMFVLMMVIYSQAFAQQKKGTDYLTKDELVGTWQIRSRLIGNGLNQHFVFSKDGTFVLNLYSDGDDARSLLKLKGKYRLTKDELYLTILSKTIVEGELEIGDMAITSSLIQFGAGAKIKEIKEPNPKEMLDPCYISILSRSNIKLNNEVYYKVKK